MILVYYFNFSINSCLTLSILAQFLYIKLCKTSKNLFSITFFYLKAKIITLKQVKNLPSKYAWNLPSSLQVLDQLRGFFNRKRLK